MGARVGGCVAVAGRVCFCGLCCLFVLWDLGGSMSCLALVGIQQQSGWLRTLEMAPLAILGHRNGSNGGCGP